jgi:hypothetical protein
MGSAMPCGWMVSVGTDSCSGEAVDSTRADGPGCSSMEGVASVAAEILATSTSTSAAACETGADTSCRTASSWATVMVPGGVMASVSATDVVSAAAAEATTGWTALPMERTDGAAPDESGLRTGSAAGRASTASGCGAAPGCCAAVVGEVPGADDVVSGGVTTDGSASPPVAGGAGLRTTGGRPASRSVEAVPMLTDAASSTGSAAGRAGRGGVPAAAAGDSTSGSCRPGEGCRPAAEGGSWEALAVGVGACTRVPLGSPAGVSVPRGAGSGGDRSGGGSSAGGWGAGWGAWPGTEERAGGSAACADGGGSGCGPSAREPVSLLPALASSGFWPELTSEPVAWPPGAEEADVPGASPSCGETAGDSPAPARAASATAIDKAHARVRKRQVRMSRRHQVHGSPAVGSANGRHPAAPIVPGHARGDERRLSSLTDTPSPRASGSLRSVGACMPTWVGTLRPCPVENNPQVPRHLVSRPGLTEGEQMWPMVCRNWVGCPARESSTRQRSGAYDRAGSGARRVGQ